MYLNVLCSQNLRDYILSSHFSLQLFLQSNLEDYSSCVCVCVYVGMCVHASAYWPLYSPVSNTKFYQNKAQNT